MRIKLYIIFALVCLSFVGCKDQDETYRDFVVPGGIIYPGKSFSVKAHPGKNRLQLAWLRSRDPRVTSARIFWNNYQDSIELDIPSDVDTIKYVFNDLDEGIYTFFVKSYDDQGNVSIPVEIAGRVFGEQYEESLLNRGLNTLTIDGEGKVEFNWAVADTATGTFATEVRYQATNKQEKTVRFLATDESSLIADYEPGKPLRYRTLYLPDSLAIDTFYTEFSTTGDFYFKKEQWKILDYSSQHSDGENAVINLIDGTDGTRWHSSASSGAYPHFVTIDLGVSKSLTSVSVWRSTFDNGGDDRGPNNIQFFVSDDEENWKDLGTYTFNRFTNGEQSFLLDKPVSGRYFKFVGLDGPENYIVLGELDIYVK